MLKNKSKHVQRPATITPHLFLSLRHTCNFLMEFFSKMSQSNSTNLSHAIYNEMSLSEGRLYNDPTTLMELTVKFIFLQRIQKLGSQEATENEIFLVVFSSQIFMTYFHRTGSWFPMVLLIFECVTLPKGFFLFQLFWTMSQY